MMKQACIAAATIFAASGSLGGNHQLRQRHCGRLAASLAAGRYGPRTARWTVAKDESAPSKPNVLKQDGVGAFPWAVLRGGAIENGFIEVKFKALAGRETRRAG